MQDKNSITCDRISFGFLIASFFLGIISFVPGGFLPTALFKGYLFIITILVAFAAWLLGRLFEGAIRVVWSPVIAAAGFFFLAFLLAALFSSSRTVSLLGESFEAGSFIMLAGSVLLLFLSSVLFNSGKRFIVFLTTGLFLYLIIALYQLVHLLFPAVTALGVFGEKLSSPVGLWSDFVFLSGAVVVGAVLVLENVRSNMLMRVLLYLAGILGLFFVILSNIFLVWVLLAAMSLFSLVFLLVMVRSSEKRRFPVTALVVVLISLLFILGNSLVGNLLSSVFQVQSVVVSPNFLATWHVARSSVWAHPVFGAGPNLFSNEWFAYRPSIVNINTLWDTPFSFGSSYFSTVAFLGGIVGILATLLFVCSVIYEIIRSTISKKTIYTKSILTYALLIMTIYFLAALLLFAPGLSIILCGFLFIGFFLARLSEEGLVRTRTFNFLKDQRSSFFAILSIIILLMVSAGALYSVNQRFTANIFFYKGIRAAQLGDVERADQRVTQAINLSDLPLFERTRVTFAQNVIQDAANNQTASKDSIQNVVKQSVSIGSAAAKQAIALNPNDPENYFAFGDFMTFISSFKVDGSFDAAREAYQRVVDREPDYPKTYVKLAQLYIAADDTKNAQSFLQTAVDKKNNYADAFFVYGMMNYQSGDYTEAVASLKQVVQIDNSYFDAWYLLALATSKAGNKQEAITILEALQTQFPDNEGVTSALKTIKSGQTPPAPTPDATTSTSSGKK